MLIVLIGMMGSGKTYIGKRLASFIDANFIDIDEYIENNEDMSITQIFNEKGEKKFRELELDYTKKIYNKYIDGSEFLKEQQNLVIATGGGAVIQSELMNYFLNANVVYLFADLETIIKRVQNSKNRPLIDSNKNGILKQIYTNRLNLYTKYADVVIDVNKNCVKDIIDEIIEKCK